MSDRDWVYDVVGDACEDPSRRTTAFASHAGLSTPASTPTRKTRRNDAVSNWTHYRALKRTLASSDGAGDDEEEIYAVGDAILLAKDTPVTQNELRGRAAPRDGYARNDARRKVTDDLPATAFLALIVDIHLDEKRELHIKVHWLLRPRVLVSGWNAGDMEDLGIAFHKKELLYASDPAYHLERERALAALTVTSFASRLKTSKAQDILPSIYIEGRVQVGSSAQSSEFFVRRRWDPSTGRAGTKDDWAPALNYAAMHEKGMSTGHWEYGEEERAKAAQERRMAASMPSPAKSNGARYQESDCSSSSSSEDEEHDEDVFRVRTRDMRSESPDSGADEVKSGSDAEVVQPSSAKRHRVYEPAEDELGRPRKVRKVSMARQKQRRERLATRAERTLARRAEARALNLPAGVSAAEAASMTPFQRARAALHVSNTPNVLPCREDEATEIYSFLDAAIDEKAGACLYISGVPGTGKTATVRSVVRDLQEFAADGKINAFKFLEINGMKLTDPYQAFSVLWEFISGKKATSKHAISLLEEHFQKDGKADSDTFVVLVDELDQLLTKKNDVIYNLFNWPTLTRSRLIVIAIANTMDLPERELSSKVISRLGDNRIIFSQYHFQQLIEIITSRLEGLDGVLEKTAIESAAKLVAKVTGDARRALDVCRRTVERVEADNEVKGVNRLVNHADIRETCRGIEQNTPAAFVARLSLHQRIFLLALSRCARNSSNNDAPTCDVMAKHLEFVKHRHLRLVPSDLDLLAVLHDLCSMHLIVADGHGAIDNQRLRLDVRDQDLEMWLSKDAIIGSWTGF